LMSLTLLEKNVLQVLVVEVMSMHKH